jgi:glucose-1-phosphatase
MQHIKNVIFDLGGVILNIDFKKTNEAFRLLGWESFMDHISQHHITDFFEQYETGQMDDETFISGITEKIGKPVTREQVVAAWNALLLDFPPERIRFLQQIKGKYKTYLLSNTNSIHHIEFQQRLKQQYGVYLEDLFDNVYYSHVVKLRKPLAAIFELVLNENHLVPAETLFVDDTASNFVEAQKLGIRIHHLVPGTSITDLPL